MQSITQFIHDFRHYEFWQNAVIGGLIISAVCSLLSVYVVLRRMAFIGQGISHSALGGFAIGLFIFGGASTAAIYVDATAMIFCLLVAFAIAMVTRHTKVSEDSAIGIFFVASMALGAIFIKITPGYTPDVYSFLFGSVLALSRPELVGIAILAVMVSVPLLLLQKEMLYYSFDEEMASISGVPVNFLHVLLLAFLSVTIVISARLVGVLLVTAFLILPGATAQLLTQKFKVMILYSLLVGVLTTMLGLVVSNALDFPSGPTIVLLQFGFFAVTFAVRKWQHQITVLE